MTIRVALEHRTTFTFAEPVRVYPHTVRLRPAPHARTPIDSYSLKVSPANHFINWQQDPFGNFLARLVFPEPVTELDITVDLVADLTVINPFDFFVDESAELFPFTYASHLAEDLEPYLRPVGEAPGEGPGPIVTSWMAEHRLDRASIAAAAPTAIVDFLVRVNNAVNADIAYTVRMEPGVQTPDHTLKVALGSCRDSAWLLVSVLRQLGLAARFVSGYLVQLVADEKPLEGPSGPTADFTDLHAWAEVFVPGAGWIGLDPTSGLFAGEGHIPLSATPHPSSSAPIAGATDRVDVSFSFSNSVTRIHEDARVTLPYSEDGWAAINAVGEHIDQILTGRDVRLTMGGEPTFVSIDDQSSAEWSTAADGPHKRELAGQLTDRLAARWAPRGVVHHGQGKWYPGEPLPRWQASIVWRRDGGSLWNDQSLLSHPWRTPSEPDQQQTQAYAHALARQLGVPTEHALPAFDDPYPRRWDEARRPVGEPEDGPVPAVAEIDEADVDTVAWVLPVFENPDGSGWGTTRWRTRRNRLYLTTGTSPAGLRLPLDSIAWNPPPDLPERSTYEERGALPNPSTDVTPAEVIDVEEAPRHAVVIEVRDGHLYVFLPPLAHAERAMELLAALEISAAEIGCPIIIEGYPLPGDGRLTSLSVTPDPGVIEVNVQPTTSWAELSEVTTTLYADARACRLGTEKFDVDGTHTGTGGGNHVTLGGVTPADSPLLRRPDLLRSLITYWQHHPALSYVFSGRFIGPTSQAPRVDEGRNEKLYELEIAFAELAHATREADEQQAGDVAAPWLADRLLRHLLTDLTGNTHRSEFCIDKLYSPDGERGRLGLLEMRGFEMPPHPQMSLVQALLVRALVARFWDEPYTAPLIRWGTRLHDRFLLPEFARADLISVVNDLNGYLRRQRPDAPLIDPAWLDPFLEFRFPRIGETTIAGVHLEARSAVEPWHVLGEEMALSGTARYVDSSVERIQIKVSGLVEGAQVLTVNQVPMPLTATEVPGEYVAGVRFRAWAPYSALHPTIGVHSPLVVDVVDRASSRSLGGFTWHVVHPGGRAYDDHPVNAMSAEARRASRFRADGHTPGPIDLTFTSHIDPLSGMEYPTTLDLRRFRRGD